MPAEIIPALLAHSQKEFEMKFRSIESETTIIQVDILDGSWIPQTSWFDPAVIGSLKTKVQFELHLMVENPLTIVAAWKARVPTLRRAIVHTEITRPPGALIHVIKETYGLEAGLAFNPETSPLDFDHLLHNIDLALIMGVQPGSSGQSFLGEPILEKIRALHRHAPTLGVGMDGGLRPELVRPLVESGTTNLYAGAFVFSSPTPLRSLQLLKDSLGD